MEEIKNIEVFLCLIFLFDGEKYMKKSDNKKEKRIKKMNIVDYIMKKISMIFVKKE